MMDMLEKTAANTATSVIMPGSRNVA